MSLETDVENSFAILTSRETKRVLREFSRRYPQEFLNIVRDSDPLANERKKYQSSIEEQPIQQTPWLVPSVTLQEFESDFNLRAQCKEIALRGIANQRIITAIKEIREIAHLDLKDARDFVCDIRDGTVI